MLQTDHAHRIPERHWRPQTMRTNATEIPALVKPYGGILRVTVLPHAHLLHKLMQTRLTEKDANEIPALSSKSSNPMVNARNAATMSKLIKTILHVNPQNLHALPTK